MVAEHNPYTVLGLLPSSSAAEIKRRYRQLAKQYHPDLNPSTSAGDHLRDLNAAYALLSTPARKSAYDAALQAQNAVFVPVRSPQPVFWVPRRRTLSRRRAFAIALLLLLSTGVGAVFSAQNAPPLSGWFSQMTSKAPTNPEQPAPSYTFLPSHGTFDTAPAAPSTPAQSGMP